MFNARSEHVHVIHANTRPNWAIFPLTRIIIPEVVGRLISVVVSPFPVAGQIGNQRNLATTLMFPQAMEHLLSGR